MKNLIFSVLPLALVSANPIEPRQENSPLAPLLAAVKGSGAPISANSLVAVLPKAKLAKVEELPPLLRPTAKRMVATYGPYTLVGKNVSSYTSEFSSVTNIVAGTTSSIDVQISGSKGSSIHGSDP